MRRLKWNINWVSLTGLFAFAILFHLAAGSARASEQVGSLTEFTGTVIVQSRGDWGVKPEKGLPLYSMDKVVTRTGTAVVTFTDGAVAEIKANSNLLIEEQEKTGAVTRNLRLLLGKVLFKTGQGSGTKTNLQTPTSVCGLRGTAGVLSIGVDGKSFIQFSEGGMSFSVGDFLSGVAKDVPAELADLNPAQRAAFVAAAAADQAKNAASAAGEGKGSDPQVALAAAKASEAAGLEAKAAAESMLNNPDPTVQQQAQAALNAANQAIEAAKQAQQKAIDAGAKPEDPKTYTPADLQGLGFDTPVTSVNMSTTISLSTTTTTTSTSAASSSSSNSSSTVSTSIPIQGSISPTDTGSPGVSALSGALNGQTNQGSITVSGTITEGTNAPYHGTVSGSVGDGSFEGYLTGVKGSFRGIFDSVYETGGGEVGFLHARLLGALDEAGNLPADLDRTKTYGAITPASLSTLIADETSYANRYLNRIQLPWLDDISISKKRTELGDEMSGVKRDFLRLFNKRIDFETKGIGMGIQNDPDTLLGVWRYGFDHGSYSNPTELQSWTATFGHRGWTLSVHGMETQFILGDLTGTDDLDRHLTVTGALDYLDEHYMGVGGITFEFHETYGPSDSDNAGAGGSIRLVKQDLGGYFNVFGGGLYYNDDGRFPEYKWYEKRPYLDGRIGLKENPEAGGYDYLAIGSAVNVGSKKSLFSHAIQGAEDNKLEGVLAGIWNPNSDTQQAALVGMYYDGSKFGILKNFEMTLLREDSIPDELWMTKGVLQSLPMAQQPTSDQVKTGALLVNTTTSSFSGGFGTPGDSTGNIRGYGNKDMSSTQYYDAAPWGVYTLALEGYKKNHKNGFDGKSKTSSESFYANLEGTGEFGSFTDSSWEALIKGTWTPAGILTGEMKGLIGDGLGLLKGTFFGVSDSNAKQGDWIGESVGYWEPTDGEGEGGSDSLYAFDGSVIAHVGEDPAKIGIVPREYGYFYLAMGDYSVTSGNAPYLQHTRISGDLKDEGGSGRFQGFIGSVWADSVIDGRITAIRTTSNGGAGILLGDATGWYFSDLGKWDVNGDLFYVPLATGLDPARITMEERDLAWAGIGTLTGGGVLQVSSSKGSLLSIAGQNWGVWQTVQGGTYTGTLSDRWSMSLSSQTQSMKQWLEVEGAKWSAEKLTMSGKASGAWVNWDKALTGVIGGDLKGTFSPSLSTWQAVASGTNLETSQFMDMIARGQTDALQKLNIPCVEIGRADLQGSGNNLSVLMKDTTFFAYRTGEKPRIWGTNAVSGNYTGAPAVNTPITLNQVSGQNANVSATFSVQNWNTVNKTWGANVDGSGTVGGHAITMTGAAAGGIDQPAAGQIKGTAAGIAK